MLAPTLWHAGLIWQRYEQVVFDLPRPELRIWCTFTDRHALTNWRDHRLVIERCSDLLETSILVDEVLTPWDRYDHACNCDDSSSLIFTGHGFGNDNVVLYCCDCLGYYPNHRASELVGATSARLQSWALTHSHVYDIWLLSGDLETWASNELQNPESELNTSGREHAKQIHRLTNKDVWYHHFIDNVPQIFECPSCGKGCSRPEWIERRSVCQTCQTIY